MKTEKIRFSIFCLVVFAIVCLPASKPVFLKYFATTNYTYYFYTTSVQNNISHASVVKNGNATIVSCSARYSCEVKSKLDGILGESVEISNPTNADFLALKNFVGNDIVFTEDVDGIHIVYAYSSNLTGYVMVNGQKVNIQIAKNGNILTIGYPLILGSF
jgi:hypothetical protein